MVARQPSAPRKVSVQATGGLKLENVPVRACAGLDDANLADGHSAEAGHFPASIPTVLDRLLAVAGLELLELRAHLPPAPPFALLRAEPASSPLP
jgi:hypothetical protein